MISNSWLMLAAIIFLVVSHSWAFFEGKKVQANEIRAEQLEAINKAIEHADKQAVADNKLAAEEVKVQEKIKIEYRYIREKANENIDKNSSYADCGLDDDGLRLYNSITNSQAAGAGKFTD